MRLRRKARGGSQIAELGPALLILFIVILFPLLDLMYLGMGYCCGWYLNQMTSRACATYPATSPTAGGPYPASVITNMNNAWLGSSLASFSGATIVSNAATAVAVTDNSNPPTNVDLYVQCSTVVKVNPFMTLASVPLINSLNIPGLTGPISFQYFDRVPVQATGAD